MRVSSFPIWVRTAIFTGLIIGILVMALNQIISPIGLLVGYGAASTLLVVTFVLWRQQQSSESLLFENDDERRKTLVTPRRLEVRAASEKTDSPNTSKNEARTQIDDTKPTPEKLIDGETDVQESELATFHITDDAGTGVHEIVMRHPRLRLGRTRDAGVDEVIPSPRISQVHCSIEYDHHEHAFYIQDEKTTNGTYVDGHKLRPRQRKRLMPASLIRLGQHFEMRFQPHVWVFEIEGESPTMLEMPRRGITSRTEFIEGLTFPPLASAHKGPLGGWSPSDADFSLNNPMSLSELPTLYEGDTQIVPPLKPKPSPSRPNTNLTQSDHRMD